MVFVSQTKRKIQKNFGAQKIRTDEYGYVELQG